MNETIYSIDDATHLLHCKHCICRSRYEYTMKCLVLKKTKSGKCKILVFGNRYWKGYNHIQRIRYVWRSKLTELNCK